MCLSRISAVSQTDGLNAHEFLKAHHHQTGPGRNRFPSLLGGQKISGRENPENTLARRRRRPSRPPAEGARGTPPPSLPPLPARTRSRAHATAHPHPRNPAVSSSSSPAAAAGWGADPSSAPRPIPPLPLVRPEAAAWTDSPSLFGLSLSARGGYGAGS